MNNLGNNDTQLKVFNLQRGNQVTNQQFKMQRMCWTFLLKICYWTYFIEEEKLVDTLYVLKQLLKRANICQAAVMFFGFIFIYPNPELENKLWEDKIIETLLSNCCKGKTLLFKQDTKLLNLCCVFRVSFLTQKAERAACSNPRSSDNLIIATG